jgi:hypothetical protein
MRLWPFLQICLALNFWQNSGTCSCYLSVAKPCHQMLCDFSLRIINLSLFSAWLFYGETLNFAQELRDDMR